MPNFNPFASDVEDTSFEQGMPVGQATKNVTNATNSQIKAQSDAAQKAIMDQLYGSGDDSSQDQNASTATKNMGSYIDTTTGMQAGLPAGSKSNPAPAGSNPNQTPEEQAKMAKIRNELHGNYSGKFQPAPNAAHGLITNIDQEMEKARQERKQKEMQRKQEEEEEEKRKKEEEEAQKQEFVMPAGKKTGFMMGKKQQQPVAVELAKKRTEMHRGTSG